LANQSEPTQEQWRELAHQAAEQTRLHNLLEGFCKMDDHKWSEFCEQLKHEQEPNTFHKLALDFCLLLEQREWNLRAKRGEVLPHNFAPSSGDVRAGAPQRGD